MVQYFFRFCKGHLYRPGFYDMMDENNGKCAGGGGLMEQFFSDDDLMGLLEELDQEESETVEAVDEEIEASNRRYREIIQKHKMK